MNDLNLEGTLKPKTGVLRGVTQNKIAMAGRTTQGFYMEASKEDDDRHKEYSSGYNNVWRVRGESLGDGKTDKKFTFRIKKEQQMLAKDKPGFTNRDVGTSDSHSNQRHAFEGVYVGYRDKNSVDHTREKRPFKEMDVNDKINKQMVSHKGGAALRLNTLYLGDKTSRDENDHKDVKQNNFLRTNGFTSGTGYSDLQGGNPINLRDTRKYEKPWLKNTVHELASTQMVGKRHSRNGGRPVRASPTAFRVFDMTNRLT